MKTKACEVEFRNYGKITIPAGLRCSPTSHEQFFLDQFPEDLFPANSMIRHDATHYGVRLNADQVEP